MRALLSPKDIFKISAITYGTQARGFTAPPLVGFELGLVAREDGLVAAEEEAGFDVKEEALNVEEEALDADIVMVD